MECGIEYDNIRQAFEDALCSAQAQKVSRVVQRSKWNTFFDTSNNIVGNQNGFAVQFAAAYHAVADRADTGVEAVGFEFFHQGFNCAGVVGLGR